MLARRAVLRLGVPFYSRVSALKAIRDLVLASPPVDPDAPFPRWGRDPQREWLGSPDEVTQLEVADCKKLSALAARKALDEGQDVDLCMSSDDEPEQHLFLRINGVRRDPSRENGMPEIPERRYQRPVIVPVIPRMRMDHMLNAAHSAAGTGMAQGTALPMARPGDMFSVANVYVGHLNNPGTQGEIQEHADRNGGNHAYRFDKGLWYELRRGDMITTQHTYAGHLGAEPAPGNTVQSHSGRRWAFQPDGFWHEIVSRPARAARPMAGQPGASIPVGATRNGGQQVWNGAGWVPNPAAPLVAAPMPASAPVYAPQGAQSPGQRSAPQLSTPQVGSTRGGGAEIYTGTGWVPTQRPPTPSVYGSPPVVYGQPAYPAPFYNPPSPGAQMVYGDPYATPYGTPQGYANGAWLLPTYAPGQDGPPIYAASPLRAPYQVGLGAYPGVYAAPPAYPAASPYAPALYGTPPPLDPADADALSQLGIDPNNPDAVAAFTGATLGGFLASQGGADGSQPMDPSMGGMGGSVDMGAYGQVDLPWQDPRIGPQGQGSSVLPTASIYG